MKDSGWMLGAISVAFVIETAVQENSKQCPKETTGPDCNFICHCNFPALCGETSDCNNVCVSGWRGRTCQQENMALKKTTICHNLYRYHPNNAVNGVIEMDIAFVTQGGFTSTWWGVDLEASRYAHEVVIYFRTTIKHRRRGLEFYQSDVAIDGRSRPNPDHACYIVQGAADGNDIDDVLVIKECKGKFQYLLIYTDTSNEEDGSVVLDFSEVEVYGCSRGTYGEDCSHFCQHCGEAGCDVTGTCLTETAVQENSKQCPKETTGPDCNFICHCNFPALCGETSDCNNVCVSGWRGRTCQQENMALKKTTICHNLYRYHPNNAVNGVIEMDIAFVTQGGFTSTWWGVDLEASRYAHEVVIYFRTTIKHRRRGLEFYQSDVAIDGRSRPNPDHACYIVQGAADGNDIDDVLVIKECKGKFQYLLIYTDTSNEEDGSVVLDFSEVEVYGCSRGTYGEDCSHFCQHCGEAGCDVDGTCLTATEISVTKSTSEPYGGATPDLTSDDMTSQQTSDLMTLKPTSSNVMTPQQASDEMTSKPASSDEMTSKQVSDEITSKPTSSDEMTSKQVSDEITSQQASSNEMTNILSGVIGGLVVLVVVLVILSLIKFGRYKWAFKSGERNRPRDMNPVVDADVEDNDNPDNADVQNNYERIGVGLEEDREDYHSIGYLSTRVLQ